MDYDFSLSSMVYQSMVYDLPSIVYQSTVYESTKLGVDGSTTVGLSSDTPHRGRKKGRAGVSNAGTGNGGVIGPVQDAQDPWAIASGNGYDIDTVYIRATDGKGHSVNVQVPMSTNIHAAVMTVVNHEATKYRSAQDFIRDAITHRARYWQEMEKSGRIQDLPGVEENVKVERLQALLSAVRLRQVTAEDLTASVEQVFDLTLKAGLITTAEDALMQLEGLMGGWADLPNYDQLREKVDLMRTRFDRATNS